MNEVKELIKNKLKQHDLLSNKEISNLMNILSYFQSLEKENEEKLTTEQLNEIAWGLHKKAQSGIKAEENETVS